MSFACHLYALIFYLNALVCHSYVIRMYPMSSVSHLYALVCHPYVTSMFSYIIRVSLVCTRMSSICHSYVLVCHPYVTRKRFSMNSSDRLSHGCFNLGYTLNYMYPFCFNAKKVSAGDEPITPVKYVCKTLFT